MSKKYKICFAASSGGHLIEIMALRDLDKVAEIVLLTEAVDEQQKPPFKKTCYVPQVKRNEILMIPKIMINGIRSLQFLLKEKPDAVISTGAMATIPVCLLGKAMGRKVIYIESYARTNNYSMTGKLLRNFADHTIVQWEELQKKYAKAIFGGPVF